MSNALCPSRRKRNACVWATQTPPVKLMLMVATAPCRPNWPRAERMWRCAMSLHKSKNERAQNVYMARLLSCTSPFQTTDCCISPRPRSTTRRQPLLLHNVCLGCANQCRQLTVDGRRLQSELLAPKFGQHQPQPLETAMLQISVIAALCLCNNLCWCEYARPSIKLRIAWFA